MKRILSFLLFCWIAGTAVEAGSAQRPDGWSGSLGVGSEGFLVRQRNAAVSVAESDAAGSAVTGVDNLNDAYKIALEKGLSDGKYKDLLGKAGKYAKVVDIALKVIKFGNLSNECRVALVNGDREAFAKHFNTLVREAVKTTAGMAGSAKGAKIGLLGIKGGPLVILTVPLGAVAGGLLAEKLAEKAYDELLADSVTDLGGLIFDTIQNGDSDQSETGGPPGTGVPHPDEGTGTQGDAPLKLRKFR